MMLIVLFIYLVGMFRCVVSSGVFLVLWVLMLKLFVLSVKGVDICRVKEFLLLFWFVILRV